MTPAAATARVPTWPWQASIYTACNCELSCSDVCPFCHVVFMSLSEARFSLGQGSSLVLSITKKKKLPSYGPLISTPTT